MRRTRRRGTKLVNLLVVLALSPSAVPWVPGAGCPHHMGPGGHDAQSSGVHGSAANGHDGAADAHGHHGDRHGAGHGDHLAEGHGSDRGPSHAPAPCDCLGKCPVPAGPALPANDGVKLASQPLVAAPSVRSASPRLSFGRAPYTLPFANGPPLS